MELLHRLDILLRRLVDLVVRVVKLVVLKISCGTETVSFALKCTGRDLRVG